MGIEPEKRKVLELPRIAPPLATFQAMALKSQGRKNRTVRTDVYGGHEIIMQQA